MFVFCFQEQKNYEFGYAVKDDYGDDFSHTESRYEILIYDDYGDDYVDDHDDHN